MVARFLGLSRDDQCTFAKWVLSIFFSTVVQTACDNKSQALSQYAGQTLTRPEVTSLQAYLLSKPSSQLGSGPQVDALIADAICKERRPVLILLGKENGRKASGHLVLIIGVTMKGGLLEEMSIADPDPNVKKIYPANATGLRLMGATVHGSWINTWVL